jgi:hypothetical protein
MEQEQVERKELESAAARVTYLRGLLAIPLGLLFIVTGLGNLAWGPFAHDWVFVASVAVLAGAALLINRFYQDRYGRVMLTTRQQAWFTVASFVLFGGGMVGGTILDSTFDLPVSLFACTFALAMLAWFAICVGLRSYHVAVWGSLLIVGLFPVWGNLPDKVSVAWLPIGVASIAAGIFDHRALVHSFGAPAAMEREQIDVDA